LWKHSEKILVKLNCEMFLKCTDLEMFLLVVNVSQMPLKVRGDGEAPGAQVTGVGLFACVSSEEIRETLYMS
jgi:hypothetical protein